MPLKRSKATRNNAEKNTKHKRPRDESKQSEPTGNDNTSTPAKRSNAVGSSEEESKSRTTKMKRKIVVAEKSDGESGAKKRKERRADFKELLPTKKRAKANAIASVASARTAATERTTKVTTKKSKFAKKRVRPQLIEVPGDRKRQAAAIISSKSAQIIQPAFHPPPEAPRQRWTELTAVGHILADEVFKYSQDNSASLSKGEIHQLNNWTGSVQHQIFQTSTLVLENTVLAAELREGQKAVESMRDEMTVIRARTKMMRDEAAQLEGNVEQTMKETSTLEGASQFLSALQSLAKKEAGQAEDKSGALVNLK